ncbi:hypothetical protein [Calothrix sp. NIES-2098]|uniref:hypothetical protein n=1 Tax=Calothrix sp. NIES-2098 TaxID=1954171 RepID=UPI000B621239|nr:hypothetical protein NIES2098_41780 [Calothrix sp. NIES-2098]
MTNSSDLRKNHLEQLIAHLTTEIEITSKQIVRTLDDVDKNKLQRQLNDKFNSLEKAESELNQLNRESSEQVELDKIPFTNRDAPIREITAIKSPPYRLVTAPEGYGKTEFLKQIQKRFQELQWCCAYASMSSYESIEDLEKRLANSLQITLPEGHELSWGERLGLLLHNNWWATWQSQNQKGIVLLIDLDGSAPQKQRLNEIFKDFKQFISRIEKCLKDLQLFKENYSRFRVIIASRCLINIPLEYQIFSELTLSPFNLEVIQDTATKYLKPIEMTSESLALLTGHLLYLTGGHPGGIAEALKVYRSSPCTVDLFLNIYGKKLWEKTLKKCRDQIKESLTKENKDLYESIEKLSIFPILNSTWILKEVVRRFQLPFSDDSFKLNIELTKTSIFTRDKTIIKDGMTRRLLVIGLLKESSPDIFRELCGEAAKICWEYVHDRKSKNESAVAGTWSMQYLFQSLQQHAGFINSGADSLAYRQKLHKDFFEQTVTETIDIFRNTDREQIHDFLSTLKSEIEHDWEFQFIVNYYLHNDEYNDRPYKDLIKKLDEAIQNN